MYFGYASLFGVAYMLCLPNYMSVDKLVMWGKKIVDKLEDNVKEIQLLGDKLAIISLTPIMLAKKLANKLEDNVK